MTAKSFNQTCAADGCCPTFKYPGLKQYIKFMSIIVFSLIFVLGVLGNGVVIWLTGFKMKKTVNTVWYLNLAVADFIFVAFLPLNVTYLALGPNWLFGQFMCKLNTTISFLNMSASVYTLVVISVDRCASVVWPVWAQNHRNVRKASRVTVGVWILALIFSAPNLYFVDTWKVSMCPLCEDKILCFNSYTLKTPPPANQLQKLHKATVITRFLLLFAVPFTVIVSCYAVIIQRLKRNRTLASQSSRPFKIIAAIIITFFLCWAPFHIMTLIELAKFRADDACKTLVYVIIGNPLTRSLAFLTSCLNPVIYVFVGKDFKKEIHKSILNWMKTAFQEEAIQSHPDIKSVNTSQRKEKPDLMTEV